MHALLLRARFVRDCATPFHELASVRKGWASETNVFYFGRKLNLLSYSAWLPKCLIFSSTDSVNALLESNYWTVRCYCIVKQVFMNLIGDFDIPSRLKRSN